MRRSRWPSPAERLMARIEVDPETDCWIYTGQTNNRGYGLIHWNGSKNAAHRLSYEVHVGPIPEGLELDHTCRRPACVNPAHLEPVTHAENMRRTRGATCARGHDLSGPRADVYIHPQRGTRDCRACKRYRRKMAAA